MALGFFDFLGFSSKRRTALQLFDRTLANLEVNPAYVDDGMRFAIYKWAQVLERHTGRPDAMDRIMPEAAAMISFCVLGAAETEAVWGAEVRREREARFTAALQDENDDGFDARLIKLALAKGIAAPDINARVELKTEL
jgi:hypothetical protein